MFSCTRQGKSLLPTLSMPATCQGPRLRARTVNYTWLGLLSMSRASVLTSRCNSKAKVLERNKRMDSEF